MLRVRLTLHAILASTIALGGAVAALRALWRGSINFVPHDVVDIGAERAFNGIEVHLACDGLSRRAEGSEPIQNPTAGHAHYRLARNGER